MALQWARGDAGRTWGLEEPESLLPVLQSHHVASREMKPSCVPTRESVDFSGCRSLGPAQVGIPRPGRSGPQAPTGGTSGSTPWPRWDQAHLGSPLDQGEDQPRPSAERSVRIYRHSMATPHPQGPVKHRHAVTSEATAERSREKCKMPKGTQHLSEGSAEIIELEYTGLTRRCFFPLWAELDPPNIYILKL